MRKTQVLKVDEGGGIERAAQVLSEGGLVAFPTDTVYGLGAQAFDLKAVAALFRAKERALDMGIPLLLAEGEDVDRVAADIPRMAMLLMRRFWPGGLTLILSRQASVPDLVAVGETVAVRLPDHDVPRALATAVGVPLATTSANLSGRPSPLTAEDVLADLDGRIDLVLDGGRCPGGIESTILDLTDGTIKFVREGAVSRPRIKSFTSTLIGSSHSSNLLSQS